MAGWRSYVRRARRSVRSAGSSLNRSARGAVRYARSTGSSLNRSARGAARYAESSLRGIANGMIREAEKARRYLQSCIPSRASLSARLRKLDSFLQYINSLRKRMNPIRMAQELDRLIKRIVPPKYGGRGTLSGARARREIENFLRRYGINLYTLDRYARRVGITGDLTFVLGISRELKYIAGCESSIGLAIRLLSRNRDYSWYWSLAKAYGTTMEATIGIQPGIYFRTPQGMPGPYLGVETNAMFPLPRRQSRRNPIPVMVGVEGSLIFDKKGISGIVLGLNTPTSFPSPSFNCGIGNTVVRPI